MTPLHQLERFATVLGKDEPDEPFDLSVFDPEPDVDILSDIEFGPLPPDVGDGSIVRADDLLGTADERRSLTSPNGAVLRRAIHRPHPFTPLKRNLHKGLQGGDVRAMQRCLHAAGFRKGGPTAKFHEPTRRQVVRYQRHHGLKHDGIVGPHTWASMRRYMDGYTVWMVQHTHIAKPVTDKIDHFVKIAWWYYYRHPLHYLQQRPMYDTAPPPNVDEYMDCSEYVYVCAKAAGLPDPSGWGYNGSGNTDSYLAHMHHMWTPKRGDLALYSNPGHVVIITGYSSTYGQLMALSHGSEGGPLYVPVHYRSPVAYLTWRAA